MALWTCNNLQIIVPMLSREIPKLKTVHAEDKVHCLPQKQKAGTANVAKGLDSFARGNEGLWEAWGEGVQASHSVAMEAPPTRFC